MQVIFIYKQLYLFIMISHKIKVLDKQELLSPRRLKYQSNP